MHFYKEYLLLIIMLIVSSSLSGQKFSGDYQIIGPTVPEFAFCDYLEIVDINGDGELDIFIESSVDLPHTFIGQSNLEFDLFTLDDFFLSLHGSTDLVDLNHDGLLDYIGFDELDLYWSRNSGIGVPAEKFVIIENLVLGNQVFRQSVDLDNDGEVDILLLDQDENLYWLKNMGEGDFVQQEQIFLFSSTQNARSILNVFDVDNDQFIDIVYRNKDGDLVWLKNSGGGNFNPPITIIPTAALSIDFSFINFVDLDSDGLKDIFLLSAGTDTNIWLKNLGDGNFGEIVIMPEMFTVNTKYSFGDIDNDGDMDIVSSKANGDPEKMKLHINNGAAVFSTFDFSNEIVRADCLSMVDIDGDGDKDVVAFILEDLYNFQLSIALFENFESSPSIESCIFFDENNNGERDATERPLQNFKTVLDPLNTIAFANRDGCTTYFLDNGVYDINYMVDPIWQLSTEFESYQIVVNDDTHLGNDFGFIPRDTILAGQMHSVSGITRCNSDVKFDFIFQNQGTTIITEGTIWVFQDSLTTRAHQINPIDTFVNDHQWGWTFENLYPGETIQRSIELAVPGVADEAEVGELIDIFSTTEALNTQGFVNFFKSIFSEPILCAYDPNDKLVTPKREEEENYTLFGDTLLYTIRFQNTGNDTAFNVVIRDTLDTDLDVSTFKILGTSHREILHTDIFEDRFVTFTFENILLPDSTINFNGSQGYVSYSIQHKEGLEENTVVDNSASIFFDFNPPILTNTTINTLVTCFPIEDQDLIVTLGEGETYELPDGTLVDEAGTYVAIVEDEEGCPLEIFNITIDIISSLQTLIWNEVVSVSPNPTSEKLFLDINLKEKLSNIVTIVDPLGKVITTKLIDNSRTIFSVEKYKPGVYFLQIRDENNSLLAVKRIVVLD